MARPSDEQVTDAAKAFDAFIARWSLHGGEVPPMLIGFLLVENDQLRARIEKLEQNHE